MTPTILLSLCLLNPAPADDRPAAVSEFVVFPADTNANPPMLFGGRVLSDMDRCAGITVRRFLYRSPAGAKDAVTVAVNRVKFIKPAAIKDLVSISGRVTAAGEKSVTVRVVAERETPSGKELLVEAEFVFVAYDLAAKKSIQHGLTFEGVDGPPLPERMPLDQPPAWAAPSQQAGTEGPFDVRDLGQAIRDFREAMANFKGVTADVKTVTNSAAETSKSVAETAKTVDDTVAGFSPTLLVFLWLLTNALTAIGTVFVQATVKAVADKLLSLWGNTPVQ